MRRIVEVIFHHQPIQDLPCHSAVAFCTGNRKREFSEALAVQRRIPLACAAEIAWNMEGAWVEL
jgi:hypothetical protein